MIALPKSRGHVMIFSKKLLISLINLNTASNGCGIHKIQQLSSVIILLDVGMCHDTFVKIYVFRTIKNIESVLFFNANTYIVRLVFLFQLQT